MNGRRRAGQVIDLIDFKEDWLNHIVAQQFEALIIEQREYVFSSAGEEVIETEHLITFIKQPLTQMRANKPRAASD
jgi:hypothetical protein